MNNTSKKKVAIYGTGGHSLVVSEILTLQGYEIEAYIDRKEAIISNYFLGKPLISDEEIFQLQNKYFEFAIVAIGNSQIREQIMRQFEKLGVSIISAIHPSVIISSSVSIGDGSVICAGAVVGFKTKLGKGSIINTNASVDHECIVGDYSHIAPGAVLCGNVTVGKHTWLGARASVKENTIIGSNAIIAMGASVINNIPNNVMCAGVPAVIKKNIEKY